MRLWVADEREVQEDDIILSHGKVMLHGGLREADRKVLLQHTALADGKAVQLRLAEAVPKAMQCPCTGAKRQKACSVLQDHSLCAPCDQGTMRGGHWRQRDSTASDLGLFMMSTLL